MRIHFLGMALAGLTACAPAIPDSGADVSMPSGAAGAPLPAPEAVTTVPIAPSEAELDGAGHLADATPGVDTAADATPDPATEDLAARARAALDETTESGSAAPPAAGIAEAEPPAASGIPENPGSAQVQGNPGLSDENDFEAVGERRSIESDAERIARNRELYKVIDPEAVPERPDGTGPNIVQYALRTQHPKGTQIYTRIGLFNSEKRYRRKCAGYPSADQAQIEFLERGGPERDRLGLDPDGDGYACGWDPSPFRDAVGG